jgi:Flp pilus assembly protein TadD
MGQSMIMRWRMLALAAAVLPGLAACQTTDTSAALKSDGTTVTASTGGSETPVRPGPGDEDLRLGKEHFRSGNFGLSEKHFRAAVEQAPDSLEPLIGLAASYDQLGRFDLADRSYGEAIRLGGVSSTVLNNRGYSYYLRRDFKRAKADFRLALRKDPENAMAKRNLALVGG